MEVCHCLFFFTGVKRKVVLLTPSYKVSDDSSVLLFVLLLHAANDGGVIGDLLEVDCSEGCLKSDVCSEHEW